MYIFLSIESNVRVHFRCTRAGVAAIILFITELRKLTYHIMFEHEHFARFSCLNTLISYFIYDRNGTNDLYFEIFFALHIQLRARGACETPSWPEMDAVVTPNASFLPVCMHLLHHHLFQCWLLVNMYIFLLKPRTLKNCHIYSFILNLVLYDINK